MEEKSERKLLASLCASLPGLRARAEAGLWSDVLDDLLDELDRGGSASGVLQQIGLFFGPEQERGPEMSPPGVDGAHLDGLAEVVLEGDYRCPRNTRCPRRAHRDDHGRVPLCALAGKPMLYRSAS